MTAISELSLRVISPEGLFFEADLLQEVVVPLADGGSIGIRPKHAPLIAETITGPIWYQTRTGKENIDLLAGILEIRDNVVTILTAGRDEESEDGFSLGPEGEYDRLIQTLVNDLPVDDVTEEGAS